MKGLEELTTPNEAWQTESPEKIFKTMDYDRFHLNPLISATPHFGLMWYEDGRFGGIARTGSIRTSFWKNTLVVAFYKGKVNYQIYEPYSSDQPGVNGASLLITYQLTDPKRCYESGLIGLKSRRGVLTHMLSNRFAVDDHDEERNSAILQYKIDNYFEDSGIDVKDVRFAWSISDSYLHAKELGSSLSSIDSYRLSAGQRRAESVTAIVATVNQMTEKIYALDAPDACKLLMVSNMNRLLGYAVSGDTDNFDEDTARQVMLAQINASRYPEYVRIAETLATFFSSLKV